MSVEEALSHFEAMYSHRGDGLPTQHVFDDKTREAARVLVAAVERLQTAGIHTRNDQCQRPACVARRERDAAIARAERAEGALRYAEPLLEDAVSNAELDVSAPCDADPFCGHPACDQSGCLVIKLRFARATLAATEGSATK